MEKMDGKKDQIRIRYEVGFFEADKDEYLYIIHLSIYTDLGY